MFLGFVSDSANIAKIIIRDSDGNSEFPDSNIGFDTIRFGTQTTSVPAPSTLLMAGPLSWRDPTSLPPGAASRTLRGDRSQGLATGVMVAR